MSPLPTVFESLASTAPPQPTAHKLPLTPYIIAIAIPALLCACVLGLAFRYCASPSMWHIRRIIWCPRLSNTAATTQPKVKDMRGLSKQEHKPDTILPPISTAVPIAIPAPTYNPHTAFHPSHPHVPPTPSTSFPALPSEQMFEYLMEKAYTLFPLPPPQASWAGADTTRSVKEGDAAVPAWALGAVSMNAARAPAPVYLAKNQRTKKTRGKENAVANPRARLSDAC